VEAAFGPITEGSRSPEVRAAKLAIEEDLVRRFRVARATERVYVDSYERFAAICQQYKVGQAEVKTPRPLPCATIGEAKEAAVTLGYGYMIFIEIYVGQKTDPNIVGAPLQFDYAVWRVTTQTTEDRNRFVGNAADLSGALASLAKRVGLAIGFTSSAAFDAACNSLPCDTREAFSPYWLGRGYLDLGALDDAEREFKKAKDADPKYAQAAMGLGDVYYARAKKARESGDFAPALASVEAAVGVYSSVNNLGSVASALVLKGDILAAQGKTKESWVSRKSAALARMNWGQTEDGYDIATKLMDDMRTAKAEDSDPDVWWLLGHAHVVLNGRGQWDATGKKWLGFSYQEGENYLVKAIDLSKGRHVPALLDRARMYRDYASLYNPDGDQQEKSNRRQWLTFAKEDLVKVLALEPQEAAGFIELGHVYNAMSDYGEKPTDAEQKASVDNIGQAARNYRLGYKLLKDQGRGESAEAGWLLLTLAACERRVKRVEAAEEAANEALRVLGEAEPGPWIEMILIQVESGKFDAARKTLDKALVAVPSAPKELKEMDARIDEAEEASNAGETWTPKHLDGGAGRFGAGGR
jgi:tetratricopeptide (TPR) repeat protein